MAWTQTLTYIIDYVFKDLKSEVNRGADMVMGLLPVPVVSIPKIIRIVDLVWIFTIFDVDNFQYCIDIAYPHPKFLCSDAHVLSVSLLSLRNWLSTLEMIKYVSQ